MITDTDLGTSVSQSGNAGSGLRSVSNDVPHLQDLVNSPLVTIGEHDREGFQVGVYVS